MSTRRQIQKRGSLKSSFTPPANPLKSRGFGKGIQARSAQLPKTNLLQTRPFGSPIPASAQQEETQSASEQLEIESRFGYNGLAVPVNAPGTSSPPVQRKLALDGGKNREISPANLPVIQRFEYSDDIEFDDQPKNWRHSDRIKWTQRWKDACLHNLLNVNREQYSKIEERRDFYKWFYEATAAKGYHTRWALAAYIVASGMAEMASVDWMEGVSPITNEMQGLARIGNQVIFDDVLPKLKELWVNGPLTGGDALKKDAEILAEEQQLIQTMYKGLSTDTMKRFQNIADNAYCRTQIGRGLGMGGHVEEGSDNVKGDVPAFSGSGGLVAGGDINKPEDRWKYGMGLGAKFSTLPGYGTPGTMPAVGKEYTSGKEFNRLNVRPNLHQLDALLNDSDISEKQVVSLLQKLNPREQTELFFDAWRLQRLENALNFEEMKKGIKGLKNIPLDQKLGLLGGSESYDWNDIDYDEIKSIVTLAPVSERKELHTDYWKGVFVKICTDDTIEQATIDLKLSATLAEDWIDEETSLF